MPSSSDLFRASPFLTLTPTPDRLAEADLVAHNAENQAVWDAFHKGAPLRPPVILGVNTRYFMFNPAANPNGLDFQTYSERPEVMLEAQVRFQRWSRFNLLQDAKLGLPDRWIASVDFQNYYEAAWFGCPVEYLADNVPDTRPAFSDCPERVMENGPPDPFASVMARALEFHERFLELSDDARFLDRPIHVNPPGCGFGTDGPMTVACNLFGPEFVCAAMAAEPERLATLFEFITTATLERMKAWRTRFHLPWPQEGWGMADDSVALISTPMYREHVLPHHRRLYDAFATDAPRSIHLCGDATRHFPTLRDELNIQTFDTGFPVDFGRLRENMGPDVTIQGGPHIELLRTASPAQVADEVTRILDTGVAKSGRFILREGNNLAPGTPLENTEAMLHACRRYYSPEIRKEAECLTSLTPS